AEHALARQVGLRQPRRRQCSSDAGAGAVIVAVDLVFHAVQAVVDITGHAVQLTQVDGIAVVLAAGQVGDPLAVHVYALVVDGRAVLDRDLLGRHLGRSHALDLAVLGHRHGDVGTTAGDLDVAAVDELHRVAGADLARGVAVDLDVPAFVGDFAHVVDVVLHPIERVVDIGVGVAADIEFGHQFAVDELGVATHALGDALAHLMDLAAVDRIGAGGRNFPAGEIGDLRPARLAAVGGNIPLVRD